MAGVTCKPGWWLYPVPKAKGGAPSGLSSGWDFSLWVAGVWHQMGHHAETVGDCGSLLQCSPCLGTGSASPSALHMYRPGLPHHGARGQSLLRPEGRRQPELTRVWATSSGDLPSFSARTGDRIAFSRAAQLPASPRARWPRFLSRRCRALI